MKTLENKIQENLTTKKGTIKAKYESVIFLILNPKSKIHPVSSRYSGGYVNVSDRTDDLIEGLKLLGIDYEQGNDAPRGGRDGNFIQLTTKGRRQVAKLSKKLNDLEKSKKEAFLAEQEKRESEYKEKRKLFQTNDILKDFFQNETHPAPSFVIEAKNAENKSWNELRSIYK